MKKSEIAKAPATAIKSVSVAAKSAASDKKAASAKGPVAKAPAVKASAKAVADVKTVAKQPEAAPSNLAAKKPAPAKVSPSVAAAASPKPVAPAQAPKSAAPVPQAPQPGAKAASKPVIPATAEPAVNAPQTNVGTVNLKTIQTVAESAPVSTPAKAPAAPPAAPAVAKSTAKPGVHRTGFKAGEYIVYPAHGVGQIVAVEEQEVAGFKLELFVISFAKDKMTLKVPMSKVITGAIRKLADADTVKKSLDTLTGRARIKRTMWSRRAQEYEAKINSGDLGSIAEVVRDLYRSEAQPEQSYSERQLYESALDRMAREIAAVQKLTDSEALKVIEANLQKGPKRGSKAEQAAEDLVEDAADGEIEQAA